MGTYRGAGLRNTKSRRWDGANGAIGNLGLEWGAWTVSASDNRIKGRAVHLENIIKSI